MTLTGQPQVTYGYDNADRMTSVSQGPANVGFTYDDAGRLLTSTLPNGVVGTYGYDGSSRVTSISYATGTTQVGDLSYTYDAAGHRTTVGGSLARVSLPAAVSTTTYNASNQLTKWINNQTKPTYDANGNMLSDGTYTYTWNARGQLTQIKNGSTVTASYSYDALGRRIGKTLSGATTGFAYNGDNFTQEKNGSGTPTANLLTGGTDQTFSRTDGAGARYFLTDVLGSTVSLVDSAGAIQTSYTYEPFGKTTVTGTANANSQQFTGRENDGPLYYYRARFYNPTFGRFISEDPNGFAAGDSNLYRYVGDSPTNVTDPSGEIAPFVAACLGGAVFSVVFDLIANAFGHRKTTLGDIVGSAASGCVAGLAGFGLGKILSKFAGAAIDGFGGLSQAGKFGVWPYSTLRRDLVGLGLEAHHLLEKRFAAILGQKASQMASVALTEAEHQTFTNAWRAAFPYGTTSTATTKEILDAARVIYKDYPDILKALGL
jgi:RHS repeat-associated protein